MALPPAPCKVLGVMCVKLLSYVETLSRNPACQILRLHLRLLATLLEPALSMMSAGIGLGLAIGGGHFCVHNQLITFLKYDTFSVTGVRLLAFAFVCEQRLAIGF